MLTSRTQPEIVSNMDDAGYYSTQYLQDILELRLLELGGEEQVSDAHDETAAHVDRHHPRDGCGVDTFRSCVSVGL